MSNSELRKRLRLCSLVILVAGIFSAGLVFLFAEDAPDDSLGYRVVNGTVYAYSTRDTKVYRHELERIGGKTLLMFDDFGDWFKNLWRGKALAKTVALVSILLSLGLYSFANSLPETRSESEDADRRDQPD